MGLDAPLVEVGRLLPGGSRMLEVHDANTSVLATAENRDKKKES